MEIFAAIIYSMLRELILAYYFYIIFKDRLRFSRSCYWLGPVLITVFEICLVIYHKGVLPLSWQFIDGFIMIPYGIAMGSSRFLKKLLVILLLAQQTFLSQTLALVVKDEQLLAIPNAYAITLTILLINIIFYPLICLAIEKYKEPFLSTDDNDILLSANLLLVFNFAGSLFMYDFQSLRTWHLFWGRFFTSLPVFLFIIILYYLAHERSINRALSVKQRYLETLRESEKRYFEYIFDSWQNSRRIRHDLRHMALLLKEYLEIKDYEGIRKILNSIASSTSIFPEQEKHNQS